MDIKPQDIVFIVTLLLLLIVRKPNWFVVAGLISLLISIPLFQQWIFFTAQRLVLYAFIFFLIAILFLLWQIRRK